MMRIRGPVLSPGSASSLVPASGRTRHGQAYSVTPSLVSVHWTREADNPGQSVLSKLGPWNSLSWEFGTRTPFLLLPQPGSVLQPERHVCLSGWSRTAGEERVAKLVHLCTHLCQSTERKEMVETC